MRAFLSVIFAFALTMGVSAQSLSLVGVGSAGTIPGSQTFTATGSFVVPRFTTLTVEAWGGGGAGGQDPGTAGGNGTASTFDVISAGGGIGGQSDAGGIGGAGGTAAGGDINTNGNAGGNDSVPASGAGGSAPNGGAGGAGVANPSTGANPGVAPGGGGGGANNGGAAHGAGGGSGAYVRKTYNAGSLTVGATITATVGAAGTVGGNGDGARGEIRITWN